MRTFIALDLGLLIVNPRDGDSKSTTSQCRERRGKSGSPDLRGQTNVSPASGEARVIPAGNSQ